MYNPYHLNKTIDEVLKNIKSPPSRQSSRNTNIDRPENILETSHTRYSYRDFDAAHTIDSQFDHDTPEGVQIVLRPAGIVARGTGFLVDELIKLLVFFFLQLLFEYLGLIGLNLSGLHLIIVFVVLWLYGFLFEWINDGMTPGKMMVKAKAVNLDGTPLSLYSAAVRNLFRPIDSVSLFMVGLPLGGVGMPGALFILFSARFRRLGDHLANTMVIHTNTPEIAKRESTATVRQIPQPLKVNEQLLLLEFQDRLGSFSEGRAIELAEILYPLHGLKGESAVRACMEYANSIRGVK